MVGQVAHRAYAAVRELDNFCMVVGALEAELGIVRKDLDRNFTAIKPFNSYKRMAPQNLQLSILNISVRRGGGRHSLKCRRSGSAIGLRERGLRKRGGEAPYKCIRAESLRWNYFAYVNGFSRNHVLTCGTKESLNNYRLGRSVLSRCV